FIAGDFSASIFSDIYVPRTLDKGEFNVYAFMNPHKSNKILFDEEDDQLLIHEQYHFNITEIIARRMRKEMVSIGKENLTKNILNRLYNKHINELHKLQSQYDFESKHNIDYER